MTRYTRVQLAKIFASTSKQTENTLSLQLQMSVILSCAYSVFLNTRGYINVIDELCMRAQLPLYCPRDWCWERSSNRLRLKTKRTQWVCGDHWNAHEVSSIDHISATLFISWYQVIIIFFAYGRVWKQFTQQISRVVPKELKILYPKVSTTS
jgi:hypothetical protein